MITAWGHPAKQDINKLTHQVYQHLHNFSTFNKKESKPMVRFLSKVGAITERLCEKIYLLMMINMRRTPNYMWSLGALQLVCLTVEIKQRWLNLRDPATRHQDDEGRGRDRRNGDSSDLLHPPTHCNPGAEPTLE